MRAELMRYLTGNAPHEKKIDALLQYGHLFSSEQFVVWAESVLGKAQDANANLSAQKVEELKKRIAARRSHAEKSSN